ncbi:UDP-N-acetyl-D-mannosamine dehydrogenase [Agrococcus casei]|uniref:UDP-N-acetyl-D-mannosamine dehydrogenase n=1 Tax=Agrococcus casei TaxID=343512 RepID=UPI003F9084D5
MTPQSQREPSTFRWVAVIGLGYIGLPTAALIASKGIKVLGVDTNKAHVEQINRGEVPFYEPDFEATLAGVVHKKLLRAQVDVPHADAYIVAVPTPFNANHELDDRYIREAATSIAAKLSGGELIVLESTSPPGTTDRLAQFIVEQRPDLTLEPGHTTTVHFAHAPERVLPGRIMVEMAENDRVIGGVTPIAATMASDLYGTFVRGQLLLTDARTAEMAKLTENSFRDVNIAFANELSVICDKLGIDVWELIELANHHPRVNILQPGPGVGGHCIAVDPWFIVAAAPQESKLIRRARETNDAKPAFVIKQVLDKAARFKSPVIAALGIAFKADIDDLRESPSLNIVTELAQQLPDGEILVAEPNIDSLPAGLDDMPNVQLKDAIAAVDAADIVVMLVDHSLFRQIEADSLREKVLIDTKGFWRTPIPRS